MELQPKYALLNEINSHLINFYHWVHQSLVFEIEMKKEKPLYYYHRERFNFLISENQVGRKEAAEIFSYLNRTGYNILCRFNSKGFFNVPFEKYKSINYPNSLYFSLKQCHFKFSHGDFEELETRRDDFV